MIEEIIEPTLIISEKIIREAIKILEEKNPEEYTEEDLLKINIAYKLKKIIMKQKKLK